MHFVTAKGILHNGGRMNLYRGCTHGCIYCDSRSRCYHIDHQFEDIEVKENAIALLEETLKHKRKKCMIGTGSMTDPYVPIEKELQMVRKALGVVADYGFGFTLITKSDLVLRDLDLLKKINEQSKCVIQMTLTNIDDNLSRKLEPNVVTTTRRFEVLKILRDEGIPTVVWLSPVLPFINDTEENIRGILDMCIEAKVYGIICFNIGMTLREGNREYFYNKLDQLYPGLKEQYIRTYGDSYELKSPRHPELLRLFHATCEKHGIVHNNDAIFSYLTHFEEKHPTQQLSLWNT